MIGYLDFGLGMCFGAVFAGYSVMFVFALFAQRKVNNLEKYLVSKGLFNDYIKWLANRKIAKRELED